MPGLNSLYQTLDAVGGAGRGPQRMNPDGSPNPVPPGAQESLDQRRMARNPQDQMQQAFSAFLNGIGIQRSSGGFSFNGQPLPPEMLSTLWHQFIGWYQQQQQQGQQGQRGQAQGAGGY